MPAELFGALIPLMVQSIKNTTIVGIFATILFIVQMTQRLKGNSMSKIRDLLNKYLDTAGQEKENEDLFVSGSPLGNPKSFLDALSSPAERGLKKLKEAALGTIGEAAAEGLSNLGVPKEVTDYVEPAVQLAGSFIGPRGSSASQAAESAAGRLASKTNFGKVIVKESKVPQSFGKVIMKESAPSQGFGRVIVKDSKLPEDLGRTVVKESSQAAAPVAERAVSKITPEMFQAEVAREKDRIQQEFRSGEISTRAQMLARLGDINNVVARRLKNSGF